MFKKSISLVTLLTVCCSAAQSVYSMERAERFPTVFEIMTRITAPGLKNAHFTDLESYKQYILSMSSVLVHGYVIIDYYEKAGTTKPLTMHELLNASDPTNLEASEFIHFDGNKHIKDLEKKLPSSAHIVGIYTRLFCEK